MFLDLVHLFLYTNVLVLETEKRRKQRVAKDLLFTAEVQLGLAHRTVRWCTGKCPVRQAGLR
jgi:ferredoxin-thioredoxin reductase catalytic subunit